MFFSELGAQAISRADVWSLIIAMWVGNAIVYVPPEEVRIFEARGNLGNVNELGW